MRVCLLPVLMATWMPSVFGFSITLYPDHPKLNQTVLFDVTGIIGQIRDLNWYRGKNTSASNQFLRMDATGMIYPGTIEVMGATLLRNGSLQITNVQEEHKGYYTISVQADQLFQATTSLFVHESGKHQEGLSPGAKVGIVVGVVVTVSVATMIAIYLYKKKSIMAENARQQVL